MINSSIRYKISRFNLEPKEEPQRRLVYLKLPRIGKISLKFKSQIKSAVRKCYGAVDPVFFFQQENCFQQSTKMRCPPPIKAWSYINMCAGVTAGTWAARTCQRLHDRIAQHIPKSIRNKFTPSRTLPTRDCKTKISTIHNCDSAIGLHLLQNDEFAKYYIDQQFSILAKARTPFHLAALEATYITIYQPVLRRHKEFVYALQIPH